MRYWPTPQDYNEAIQNPRHCFSDPDLKQSSVLLNALGIPRSASGTFASVYKLSGTERSWAVRCFLSQRPEQKERYKHISDFVLFDDLDATVDFHYIEEGIKVRNEWFPCLKMNWIEGETLDQFVEKFHHTSDKMTYLLKEFHKMVGEMEGAGIAHGDLQHGNIMIAKEGLRLVDYDALYVPALAGRKSLEVGHPNYQHPGRTEDQYDPDVDNFSCWVIHISLLALAVEPRLYEELGGGDDCLLFKRSDFLFPEESRVFNSLLSHSSRHLQEGARLLKRMLLAKPETIPYLGAAQEQLNKLPALGSAQVAIVSQGHLSDGLPRERPAAPEVALYDINSVCDSIDERRVEPKDSGRKKGSFDRACETTFATGRKARDRIQKMADDLERHTVPSAWFNRKMSEARAAFHHGSYPAAIRQFLDAYKVLDGNHPDGKLIEVLTWLGYSYSLNGNPTLASNYFLLALNAAKASGDLIERAVLALAVSRFESGNEPSAVKVLEDNRALLIELNELFKPGFKSIFFTRSVTFYLLQTFALKLLMFDAYAGQGKSDASSASEPAIARQVSTAALWVFNELVKERSVSCDERMLDTVASTAAALYRARQYDLAQEMFMDLGDACGVLGLKEQERMARFCGAVVLSVSSPQFNALEVIADFGPMSENELTDLAISSRTYVSEGAVAGLLVSMAAAFDKLQSQQERREALRVLVRFAAHCRSAVDEHVAGVLQTLPDEIMYDCLKAGYLAESADWNILSRFVTRLIEWRITGPLTCIIKHFASIGNESSLGLIVLAIAEQGEVSVFKSVLKALIWQKMNCTASGASKGEPAIDNDSQYPSAEALLLMKHIVVSCRLVVQVVFARMKDLNMKLLSSDTKGGTLMNQCLQSVELINVLRNFYAIINQEEEIGLIDDELICGSYTRVLRWWMEGVVDQKQYEKLADYALLAAGKERLDLLGELCFYLSSVQSSEGLDIVGRQLRCNGQISALLKLALIYAESDQAEPFKWTIAQIADKADPEMIVNLIDRLLEKPEIHEKQIYLCAIVKELLEGKRFIVLLSVLQHMYDCGSLDNISWMALDFIDTTYDASIFAVLLAEDALAIAGYIVRLIAMHDVDRGLKELAAMSGKKNGDSNLMITLLKSALQGCAQSLQRLYAIIDSEAGLPGPDIVFETRWLMLSLLNLRTYIYQERWQKSCEGLLETILDDKYDCLIMLWIQTLIDGELDKISLVARDLAESRKSACLLYLMQELARSGQRETIKEVVIELMSAGFPLTVVSIAIDFIAEGDLDNFRAVSREIVKHLQNDEPLTELIIHTSERNEKVMGLLIREVSHSDKADLLIPVAFHLAEEHRFPALNLVLEELMAMELLDIDSDMDAISDAAGEDGIRPLAQWLMSLGLHKVVEKRMHWLKSQGRRKEASLWLACLREVL